MARSLYAEFLTPVILSVAESTGRKGWLEIFLRDRNPEKMNADELKALVDEAIKKLRIIRVLDEMHQKRQTGGAAVAALTVEAAQCGFTLAECGITQKELDKLGREPSRREARSRCRRTERANRK